MVKENESLKLQHEKPSFILSMRFVLAILVFFGYAVQYAQKINLSVSIVCMTNNTALRLEKERLLNVSFSQNSFNESILTAKKLLINQTDVDSQVQCAFQTKTSQQLDGEFVWNREQQGYILGSYFIGYLITEIPGGFLSWKFGAKNVYLIAMFLGSVGTFLTPISAKLHYSVLILVRFFTGLVHGVMWPTVATIWSHWAVPSERSRLLSIGNAGSQIGNVVALPLGGYLCVNGFAGGWPSIFYVFGIAGMVWCIGWFVLVADTPAKHKIISQKERDYIMESCHAHDDHQKVPWKKLLTSKPCIAVMIAHFCSNSGIYLFLTNIPTYMRDVLKFDIKSNGALSALPYIVFWFMIVISGIIGDKIIQSKTLSRTAVRKIFNCLGFIVPMISIIALSFVRCNMPYLGVALLVVGLSFNGCAYGAGFLVNFNDIVGKYAGILFGISNTFGSLPGILQPYLVGLFTKNQKAEEWQIVFLITAGVYMIGAIGFFALASGSLQSFAVVKQRDVAKNGEDVPLDEIEQDNF